MSSSVALATLREFGHDPFWMGNTVAIGALRHHSVPVLMTVGTGQLRMLGLAGGEMLVLLGMAGTAEFGGNIFRVGDLQRHVGLVAGGAVLHGLALEVRAVAIQTFRRRTVLRVAGGAAKRAMGTFVFL